MVVEPTGLFVDAFSALWGGVAMFVPKLIFALAVFIIGWIVAIAFGKAVSRIADTLKVNDGLKSLGIEETFSRAGFNLDVGAFLGGLVRWFIIIVFLIAAADVLQLTQVTSFLEQVVLYLPSVLVATIILIAAALIADFVQKLVRGSADAANFPSGALLGGLAKWAIWVFAALIAFEQLGIAEIFIRQLFTAFVAMIALAGGLAFGLGGKDHASRFLDRLRDDIKKD